MHFDKIKVKILNQFNPNSQDTIHYCVYDQNNYFIDKSQSEICFNGLSSRSNILICMTAQGASYHVKGKIHRAFVQRGLTYGTETCAMKAENLSLERKETGFSRNGNVTMAKREVLKCC